MGVSATVSEGCRVSTTPVVKAGSGEIRRQTSVTMRCGKPTTFAISLRGAASAAKSRITRAKDRLQRRQQQIRVDPKRAFGKRIYRASAGKVAKFVASSRLKRFAPQHSRKGNRGLVIAIDF